jgi:hypothetical protein
MMFNQYFAEMWFTNCQTTWSMTRILLLDHHTQSKLWIAIWLPQCVMSEFEWNVTGQWNIWRERVHEELNALMLGGAVRTCPKSLTRLRQCLHMSHSLWKREANIYTNIFLDDQLHHGWARMQVSITCSVSVIKVAWGSDFNTLIYTYLSFSAIIYIAAIYGNSLYQHSQWR